MKNSEEAVHAINVAATTKVQSAIGGTIANGTIAGGSAATAHDPQVLGNYLATHYYGPLTYSEYIAIAGFAWVIIQILKTIIPLIIQLVRTCMPKKPTQPTRVASTGPKVKKPKPIKSPT